MAIFDDYKDNQTSSGIFDDGKLNSKKIIIDEDDLYGFEHIDNYLKTIMNVVLLIPFIYLMEYGSAKMNVGGRFMLVIENFNKDYNNVQ